MKQNISKNTIVNFETIDQFKKKITETEETISHPFFKKISSKDHVGVTFTEETKTGSLLDL